MDHSDTYEYEGNRSNRLRTIIRLSIVIIMILMAVRTWNSVNASQTWQELDNSTQPGYGPVEPTVRLKATSGASILFMTNNGWTNSSKKAERRRIPHLVLYRNGVLTGVDERTLLVTLADLQVPAAGITVTLKLETQHTDPDQNGTGERISVYEETRVISHAPGGAQPAGPINFEITFDENTGSDAFSQPTPTDYYRYEIMIQDGNQPGHSISKEYAFLLERQWATPLGAGHGTLTAAGPHELVLYYCDMFPFVRDASDNTSRVPRAGIPAYVEGELGPQMLQAIRVQTLEWGFSWAPAWSSFIEEQPSNQLGVALSEGETWFHGKAPKRGHGGIAINVNGGNNKNYDSLTDGLMSTFHHELFHNFQRSMDLESGGNGEVDGKEAAWQFFSEGMASFLPSVAQPQVQYAQSLEPRAYLAKAIKFVGGKGFFGDLNNSITEMTPYHSALYWRFLYEKCGGMSGGGHSPQVGMRVIRHTMSVLYSRQVVDIHRSNDLVAYLPELMDQVLASPAANACPFHTYATSLAHFARDIYALRLEAGECALHASEQTCGFYDPNKLYSQPSSANLVYTGAETSFSAQNQPYPAGIRNSFGMDFVEISLAAEAKTRAVRIEFHGENGSPARFDVQVWKIAGQSQDQSEQATVASSISMPSQADPETGLVFEMPTGELQAYQRLAVIITRVDASEADDAIGAYTLIVSPGT